MGTAAAADTTDFATAAQGSLADSATQPGDNVSTLSNDANYITSTGAPVQSVNTQTGAVVLDADDIDDTSTTNKFTTAGEISKLAGIEAGAQVNVATNLGVTSTTTSNTITSSTGTNATIGEATGSAAGLMSTTHHNKLDGIAAGATNVTNNNQLTNGAGYVTSSGNTVIGTDSDIDTSGATVIDTLTMTDGVITAHSTRTMTLADLGYTGATNANYITNNNELTNGAGYITSSGSANYATSAGNADTVDSLHASSFLRSDVDDSVDTGKVLRFDDNAILSLGSSNDAQFYCNGSHLYLALMGGIGNFYINDGVTTRFTFDDAGDFTATGNVAAYSDINLKENIEVIPNALEKVSAIRGVTYDRKDLEGARHAGVIAQEVEAVLPEVVMTDDNGVKSVAYGNLVGLLIEAVKELKAEVETLRKERN